MRRPEPEPALLTGAPFRLADAHALGVSRARLRSGLWRSLGHDLYVAAATPDSSQLFLDAARLVLPAGVAVSGATAAMVHGVDVSLTVVEPVDVTTDKLWVPRRGSLLRPHRAPLPEEDVTEIDGVLTTTPIRTVFDLARRRDLREAVVAIDAFWHAGLVTPAELLAFAETRCWPDTQRLRAALALANSGAESPMETRLRLVLVLDAGLPQPETQYEVRTADGQFVARLDMAYPQLRLGVEFDGRVHEDRSVSIRDNRRHNRLTGVHWRALRYRAEDYYLRRHVIVAEVSAELRASA
jgi:hypothetical protein